MTPTPLKTGGKLLGRCRPGWSADAPMSSSATITFSSDVGRIFYTVEGSDPRKPGGAIGSDPDFGQTQRFGHSNAIVKIQMLADQIRTAFGRTQFERPSAQNASAMTLVGDKGWKLPAGQHPNLNLIGMAILAFGLVVVGGCQPSADTVHRSKDARSLVESGLSRLLTMVDHELAQLDVAELNHACAEGVGAEVSFAHLAKELDRMADRTRSEIERNMQRFTRNPDEFDRSVPYFRLLCLVTVLQQDFGVRYDPDRARPNAGAVESNESFYADSKSVFLSGLTGPARVGTCASLPVLYVAVGRRLGYPMKLVATRNHLFARWDDGTNRLNVEATSPGLVVFDDDYYRRWPTPISPEEERRERYLVALSPREELGVFLSVRAHCLAAVGRWQEAVDVQEEVCRRFPISRPHAGFLRELAGKTNGRAGPAMATQAVP